MDLEAVVANHTSNLDAAAARFIILDCEISTSQSRLGALSQKQLKMDTTRAVDRKSSSVPTPTSSKASPECRVHLTLAKPSRSFQSFTPFVSMSLAAPVSFVPLHFCCNSLGESEIQ